MKKTVFLVAAVFLTLGFVFTVLAQDLVWENIGRENSDLRTVSVDFSEPRIIYIGSSNAVLKSEDGGENWRNILSVRGQNKGVNFLSFNLGDNNSLYAATGNGLYFSHNRGRNWNRVFKGKNYPENECTTLAVLPSDIYLGTKAGLFVSQDKGRSWHKETTKLGNSHILAIAYNIKEPNFIYVACMDGVFKSKDNGQSWERTFVASPAENGNETEEIAEDQDEAERNSCIRYISIDPNNANYLYLATSRGVYRSQDKGQNWESLSSFGLLNQDVRFLLVSSESHLYAVTKSGIFEYMYDRWQELSLGLVLDDIRFLALDKQNNLYAACDKGLFKTRVEYSGNKRQDNPISLYYKDEPNISEIQQAAIKYAEVEPEKIIKWRKQASKRALLPKLTVGMDRDKNKTTSKSVWGTYSSYASSLSNGNMTMTAPGRYYVGPDDETCYKNNNWGVSLSWELGDLIFSDDQTNINVRSRLLVQLRDDILDEVTKLYFRGSASKWNWTT